MGCSGRCSIPTHIPDKNEQLDFSVYFSLVSSSQEHICSAQYAAITSLITVPPGPVVSVIQDTIPQSNKDSAGNFDDMFDSHIKLSEQAAEDDVKENLIIWPETIVPAHINQEFLDLKNKYDLLTDNLKVNVDAGLEFNKRLMKLANDAGRRVAGWHTWHDFEIVGY